MSIHHIVAGSLGASGRRWSRRGYARPAVDGAIRTGADGDRAARRPRPGRGVARIAQRGSAVRIRCILGTVARDSRGRPDWRALGARRQDCGAVLGARRQGTVDCRPRFRPFSGAGRVQSAGRVKQALGCAEEHCSWTLPEAASLGRTIVISNDQNIIIRRSLDGRAAQSRRIGIPPPADAGQDLGGSDQRPDQSARSRAGLLAGRRLCVQGDRGQPRRGGAADLARQPGGRGHQRHGGAGAGQHRSARGQAGDGGQGLPVQEIRRHRRVRHRAERARPGEAGGHHRRVGAYARRYQPRGHQGAGVLLHRAQAARADEDSGVPRRPARHRDHRGRGGDQRTEGGRQADRQGQAGLLGRGRFGHRLPRPAGAARAEAREHLRVRQPGRDLRGPRGEHGTEQGPLRAQDRRRARWPR